MSSALPIALILVRNAGDIVLAFWWGLWWRGKIHNVARRTETLTVRFDWSGNTHSGYKPRCVHKLSGARRV